MKILIGFLAATLSLSAYAVTITNNAKDNKHDINVQGLSQLSHGVGGPDYGQTWIHFQNFNQAFYDLNIPQMSITVRRHSGTDGKYWVYASGYTDVNYAHVNSSGCEVTLNGQDINAAILSDQCY